MSPAATLTDDHAEAAIAASADALFYRQGVATTSMADIRDHSGVSFRRIYRLYPTKSDLVAGWLRHRHETWIRWFDAAIDRSVSNGLDPIDAVFTTLADWLTDTDFRGCGFLNTLAEATDLTDEHRAIIRTHKRALVGSLARFGSDPAVLAVLVDGAIVRAATERSTVPVDDAMRAARALQATEWNDGERIDDGLERHRHHDDDDHDHDHDGQSETEDHR